MCAWAVFLFPFSGFPAALPPVFWRTFFRCFSAAGTHQRIPYMELFFPQTSNKPQVVANKSINHLVSVINLPCIPKPRRAKSKWQQWQGSPGYGTTRQTILGNTSIVSCHAKHFVLVNRAWWILYVMVAVITQTLWTTKYITWLYTCMFFFGLFEFQHPFDLFVVYIFQCRHFFPTAMLTCTCIHASTQPKYIPCANFKNAMHWTIVGYSNVGSWFGIKPGTTHSNNNTGISCVIGTSAHQQLSWHTTFWGEFNLNVDVYDTNRDFSQMHVCNFAHGCTCFCYDRTMNWAHVCAMCGQIRLM